MAVPKRKTSRSNTRSRRAQWKAAELNLVTCANRACGQPTLPAPGLPDLRSVRRPSRYRLTRGTWRGPNVVPTRRLVRARTVK